MIAAIVPAAGRSLRMGRPKLLLDLQGQPVIARVVSALVAGGVDRVIVVAPPPVSPEAEALARAARNAGARVVQPPSPTADMRETVEVGLEAIDPSTLVVLLAPGDSVGLTAGIVSAVLARFFIDPTRIVVPSHEGRRGHPLALPANLARAIRDLPEGVGVNRLLRDHERLVDLLDLAEPGLLLDLDTPEDYRRLSRQGPAGK